MERGENCPRVDISGRKIVCGECDYCQFRRTLTGAFALYPSVSMTEFTVDAYFDELREFELRTVLSALQRARAESPQWVPSGPIVKAHAKAIAKTTHPYVIPINRQLTGGVAGRSLPEDNPFQMLARSWERESRELGLDPNQPTPHEIGKRRMEELVALLEGKMG